MGGERVAEFKIGVTGDDVDIRAFLGNLRTQFNSAISDIQSLTRKTNLFEGLEQNVQDAAAALARAKQDVATFTGALDAAKGAGKDVTKELQTSLAAAQKATTSATTEYNRQVDALSKLQGTLSRAGVDTGNLAAAQAKLAEQSKNATNAAANQAAQQLLGLKTVRDTTPEVQRLYAAYNTLSTSGTLSAKELAVAQQLLTTKVAETKAGVSGLAVASVAAGPNLVSMFVTPLVHALGLTAGIAGVVHVVGEAIQASKDFQQGVAQIGSVTNLSKEELAGLGRAARDVAQEIGINLDDALKGLYDLIRSGVPPSNAIEVLKISAEAAKAALTDTGTGVKAANLLISAFGAGVGDLAGDFDILVQSQSRGGATLKEFADNAGPLLNVARAAGIGLQDLVATLGVMANASGDATQSIGDLQKIITKLGEPGTRSGLRDLGIDTTTLVTTFQGIAASGKTVDQILALGVASTKSAAGVAALTNNADQLAPSLVAAGNAAGTTAEKLAALYDTPKERSERFNAALHETAVIFGEALGSGSRFQELGTLFLTTWNSQVTVIRDYFNPAAAQARDRLNEMADASKKASTESAAHTAKITEQRAELTRLAADLDKQIRLIQAGTTQDLADLSARADAQIAALDKTARAEAKTASDTLAIRTKLANDIFVVLTNSETKITAATAAAVDARTKLGKEANQTDAELSAAIAKIRLDGITQTLAGYQNYYKTLQEQENAYLGKVASVAAQRLAFNQDVEQKIFDLRNQGLSSFDQYLATVTRIDKLISLEREAAANGDIELARKYADEAIKLSGNIKTATSVNGATIVTNLQAQTTAVDKTREAADILDRAYEDAGKSAKKGADDTKEQMGSIAGKIRELQNDYDVFKKNVAEGVTARLNVDQDSIKKANADIDAVAKERIAVIKVQVQQDDGTPVGLPLSSTGFAAGGRVGRPSNFVSAVRHYASGGSVFREPTWTKVPGSGNEDTVPARLSIGSFVMRKVASQYYGDDAMNKLARRYAVGGSILNPDLSNNPFFRSTPGGLSGFANDQYQYPDPRWVDDWQIDPGQDATDGQRLQAIKREADQFFDKLLEWGYGLPSTPFGDLSDYIRRAHDRLNRTSDINSAIAILENMKGQSDTFITTFRAARTFHVPAVQPVTAIGLDDLDSLPFGSLAKAQQDRLAARKKKFGFADGGGVGADTIPAYLTPGEHVLKPKAVSFVARMFGGGFLDELNQMRVPRGFLDNIGNITPPPRPMMFADGGPVPGGPAFFESPSAPRGDAPIKVEVHLHGTPADFASPSNFRRFFAPALREIQRRSGKKS